MSLRTRVLRGGTYLILRQGLAIVVGAVGMILLTRAIGPEAYGLYVGALGIYSYLIVVCQWRVEVYLIRREGEPPPQDYHQASSLLLLMSLAGVGLALLALPFLERWMRLEGFGPVAMALVIGLPVMLLGVVPLARLERALDYRRVALVELSGQIANYIVALPLAYQGLGPWAPVAGVWASQLLTLGLLYRMSGYRPRLYWEPARVRAMMGYGLGLSAALWLQELRNLVNPLVVGRYAGAEAVGQVALAIRIVEQFGSVILVPFWRLSIPVFARLQKDQSRLVKAVAEGMSLQVMTLGAILAGFGLVAPWIVPLLFGADWLSALEVYPFVALGYLASAALTLHYAVFEVLRRIWKVAIFRLVQTGLLAGSALLLVPHLGLEGYGWAEVAAVPSLILLLIWFRVYIGKPISAQAGVWFLAWTVPLFSSQLGPWAWTSVIVPLILPSTRRELLQAVAMVLRRTHRP